MTALDPLDEQKSVRLRQRLWGAAVLIALLVIFLPLLLDGSGSESQYRRVERLRAEPPRVLSADGVPEPAAPVADRRSVNIVQPTLEPAPETANEIPVDVVKAVESATADAANQPASQASQATNSEQLRAWVVQAGSFGDEANALAVRDKLRRAGFPSFVTPTDTQTPLYRVRVGPMINLAQAESSRDKVMRLLDREAIVVSYP